MLSNCADNLHQVLHVLIGPQMMLVDQSGDQVFHERKTPFIQGLNQPGADMRTLGHFVDHFLVKYRNAEFLSQA